MLWFVDCISVDWFFFSLLFVRLDQLYEANINCFCIKFIFINFFNVVKSGEPTVGLSRIFTDRSSFSYAVSTLNQFHSLKINIIFIYIFFIIILWYIFFNYNWTFSYAMSTFNYLFVFNILFLFFIRIFC